MTEYALSYAPPRFRSKVRVTESGCWEWLSTIQENGYGTYTVRNQTMRAHRIAYEHFIGPIPDDLQTDHLCRVRKCVNPAHLELVTTRENTLRGVGPTASNAAKTHCKRGHEFTPENTYERPSKPGRECLTCKRAFHGGGRGYVPKRGARA